jgi:tetrahydromethanopterin S-methyltransferase subunit A
MKTKFLLIGACIAFTFFVGCNSDENTNEGTAKTISNEEIVTNSKIDASIEDVTNIAKLRYYYYGFNQQHLDKYC